MVSSRVQGSDYLSSSEPGLKRSCSLDCCNLLVFINHLSSPWMVIHSCVATRFAHAHRRGGLPVCLGKATLLYYVVQGGPIYSDSHCVQEAAAPVRW